MVVRCRIRRRKTFWVPGACVGTLRAIEEEMGHDRVSQNLLKRLHLPNPAAAMLLPL
jgi:hypothetical protein